MREFGAGFLTLLRGFGWWTRRPGLMVLGLVPALIVAIAAGAALVAWGFALPSLADALTPFADGWLPFWAGALRVAVGTALFGAALLLVAVTFTALTLALGEPFYDRIWRAVERDTTGTVPDSPYGFWRAIGDAARLIGRGILAAVVAGLVGLVPLVGAALGFVAGVLLTGWLLADELSSRALTARGLDRTARRNLLRPARARFRRRDAAVLPRPARRDRGHAGRGRRFHAARAAPARSDPREADQGFFAGCGASSARMRLCES